MRTNYIETNIDEEIDMKNQITITNLPDPVSNREAASKSYCDKKFNDPSIKNSAHVDFNDKSLDNVGLDETNADPAVGGHLTRKTYVGQIVDETTLVRYN